MFCLRMTSCLLSLLFFFPLVSSIMAAAQPAGCKIRITDKGLEMLKFETQKFVQEELGNISMPEMNGIEGRFQYNITDVKIKELNLTHADLQFIPEVGLLFDVQNSSISLSFHRRILYWFLTNPTSLTSFKGQLLKNPNINSCFHFHSVLQETKFNAKVSMTGKRLAIHADLRRFKIFSNQSALESLALIPLQVPLKTMLQMSVVPLINNWTKRGVRIPLADGMDFIEEVVEYHNGFIVIGANLQFSKGLREMIAGNTETEPETTTV
ncbi:phospholipid transfer protein [Micropterus dolomieu]|uniref:phospholipid transfer protein n=1 Tax=Micropterus dolomieu TaxID=147949 RepID=UPI001E8D7EF2|nr:phospholipid transfer protein [Micropterus dolomieu]